MSNEKGKWEEMNNVLLFLINFVTSGHHQRIRNFLHFNLASFASYFFVSRNCIPRKSISFVFHRHHSEGVWYQAIITDISAILYATSDTKAKHKYKEYSHKNKNHDQIYIILGPFRPILIQGSIRRIQLHFFDTMKNLWYGFYNVFNMYCWWC